MSWCKFEVTVDCPKDIHISPSSSKNEIPPPVVVTAINLKTIINEKQNVNEIVSASFFCCHKVKVCSRSFLGGLMLTFPLRIFQIFIVSHYLSFIRFAVSDNRSELFLLPLMS